MKLCEHGVPEPRGFVPSFEQHSGTSFKLVAVRDNRECPACLKARLETLKDAIRAVMVSVRPDDLWPMGRDAVLNLAKAYAEEARRA